MVHRTVATPPARGRRKAPRIVHGAPLLTLVVVVALLGSSVLLATSSGPGSARAALPVDPAMVPLTASATASPSSGTAPLTVHLASVASGGSTPYRYNWSFGGASTSDVADPSHTYAYAGTYHPTVRVTGAGGATVTASVTVLVAASTALTASISAAPTSGPAPLQVQFNGSASGGVAPYAYAWTFGDGTNASTMDHLHKYTTAGSYGATLTVTDAKGTRAKATTNISVGTSLVGVVAKLLSAPVAATTPHSFWSIAAQTTCATCIASSSTVDGYLAKTPFTWVRYGENSEGCNVVTNVQYSDGGFASKGCMYNVSALKRWCASTTPHCHAILSLPGEINNSAEDAAIASYIVNTVGFQPDYWSIGNEPTGWTHYGIAWSNWRTTDQRHASPMAYAYDVKAAIAAVKKVDPAAKFIGVEAACSCNTLWFTDIAKVDGASLSAFAYHLYPSTGSMTPTLAQFYGPLSGSTNISGSYGSVRSAIAAGCSTCARLPIFINEYNAGPGWSPSNLDGSYANAVFEAASVADALRVNVSQFTFFTLQTFSTSSYGYALLNGKGVPSPVGVLFSTVLPQLALGQVRAPAITATAAPGVHAVITRNATSETLLVVNTNLSHAVALSLGSVFPSNVLGTATSWKPGATSPAVTTGLLALRYTVRSQGILLLRVPLSATGVPLGPATPSAPPPGSGIRAAVAVVLVGSATVLPFARDAAPSE